MGVQRGGGQLGAGVWNSWYLSWVYEARKNILRAVCPRYFAWRFTFIDSCAMLTKAPWEGNYYLSPFYRWGSRGLGRLSHLPKVIHLLKSGSWDLRYFLVHCKLSVNTRCFYYFIMIIKPRATALKAHACLWLLCYHGANSMWKKYVRALPWITWGMNVFFLDVLFCCFLFLIFKNFIVRVLFFAFSPQTPLAIPPPSPYSTPRPWFCPCVFYSSVFFYLNSLMPLNRFLKAFIF